MEMIETGLAQRLDGKIALKRRSATVSLLLLVAGIAIIVCSAIVPSLASGFMHSCMIFIGGIAAIIGLLLLLSSIFTKQYYYLPESSRLHKKVEYFDLTEEFAIKKSLEEKDAASLEGYRKSTAPTMQVVLYKTGKGTLVAAQLQKYVPYTYQPVTDIILFV